MHADIQEGNVELLHGRWPKSSFSFVCWQGWWSCLCFEHLKRPLDHLIQIKLHSITLKRKHTNLKQMPNSKQIILINVGSTTGRHGRSETQQRSVIHLIIFIFIVYIFYINTCFFKTTFPPNTGIHFSCTSVGVCSFSQICMLGHGMLIMLSYIFTRYSGFTGTYSNHCQPCKLWPYFECHIKGSKKSYDRYISCQAIDHPTLKSPLTISTHHYCNSTSSVFRRDIQLLD